MKEYLDIAKNEEFVIQRVRTETFVLSAQARLKQDADLHRAIPINTLLESIKEDVRTMYRSAK